MTLHDCVPIMRKFFLVIVTLLSFGVLCNAQYDKDVFAFRGRLADRKSVV